MKCSISSGSTLFVKTKRIYRERNTIFFLKFITSDPSIFSMDHPDFIIPPQTLFVVGILFSRCPSVRAIPPQTLFVVGILFSHCPSVRACVRPSVTFCFFNNLKSHRWIFIKPCKHVHICKTNTLDKKVRARGLFYWSYFPL